MAEGKKYDRVTYLTYTPILKSATIEMAPEDPADMPVELTLSNITQVELEEVNIEHQSITRPHTVIFSEPMACVIEPRYPGVPGELDALRCRKM